MFLRREFRVWPNMDVEVHILYEKSEAFSDFGFPVFDDVHHISYEVHRHPLRERRQAYCRIPGS